MDKISLDASNTPKKLKILKALQPVHMVMRVVLFGLAVAGVVALNQGVDGTFMHPFFTQEMTRQYMIIFLLNELSMMNFKYKMLSALTGKKL